jgi:predicted amidohydrolase
MHYKALALQATCHAVNTCRDRAEAHQVMLQTIERLSKQIRASKAFIGGDLRLVVLPEYFLTGFPVGESIEAWRDKAAIAPEGAEYEAFLGDKIIGTFYLYHNLGHIDCD